MDIRIKPHEKFPAVYQATLESGIQRLATKNLTPGRHVYGERLIHFKGDEYPVRTAKSVKEASELIESGFEYVTEMDGVKLFRKRK